MNSPSLFFIALIIVFATFTPARSYAQFADNNIRIPAKRTYTISSRSVLSNAIPSTPAPFAFESRTIEAVPINYEEVCHAISYPAAAIAEDVSGTVQVRILVSEAGTYLNHKIMYSPGPALTHAVETHINTLSFRPASHEGIAATSWISLPFSFELEDWPTKNF